MTTSITSSLEGSQLALPADVHGNLTALEAVLADLDALGGADELWVLGDLVALGPDPVEVTRRLRGLPNARCTRGNTDRYVATGDRPPPSLDDARADPGLIGRLAQVASTFSWTQGAVTVGGHLDWLTDLPLELRLTLPDGTRLLGVHASPGEDDGSGLREQQDDRQTEALLAGAQADLVVVGHTHHPLERTVAGVRAQVLAPVSMHLSGDLRAGYSLLDADRGGYRLERRYLDYDREGVVRRLERQRHPGAEFIARHLR